MDGVYNNFSNIVTAYSRSTLIMESVSSSFNKFLKASSNELWTSIHEYQPLASVVVGRHRTFHFRVENHTNLKVPPVLAELSAYSKKLLHTFEHLSLTYDKDSQDLYAHLLTLSRWVTLPTLLKEIPELEEYKENLQDFWIAPYDKLNHAAVEMEWIKGFLQRYKAYDLLL